MAPDGSSLNIFGALTSDAGKYTCIATNAAGEEDRIFNVNVYGELCVGWVTGQRWSIICLIRLSL